MLRPLPWGALHPWAVAPYGSGEEAILLNLVRLKVDFLRFVVNDDARFLIRVNAVFIISVGQVAEYLSFGHVLSIDDSRFDGLTVFFDKEFEPVIVINTDVFVVRGITLLVEEFQQLLGHLGGAVIGYAFIVD